MLSSVWYPLDYFKLSFGKQDGFKDLAGQISGHMTVDNHVTAKSLKFQIENKLPPEISEQLKRQIEKGLMRWVCYRFLSPFFEAQIRGHRDHAVNKIIKRLSQESTHRPNIPYSINDHSLTLNEAWRDYFNRHQGILRGFIRWHLVKFLQKNNPNVIGLSEKLEKPLLRDLKVAKLYWSKFITSNAVQCIYSKKVLTVKDMSLDHFIPWSYIAHDQLWNIIPTTKSVNSSKGDALPNLDLYLDGYCRMQHEAYLYHLKNSPVRLLEDYFNILSLNKLQPVGYEYFFEKVGPEILTNHRSALHLGFSAPFVFKV